jgi:hypothetical protein
VANDAVRSSKPDPLLVRASELVDQLLRASSVHGLFLDWCVGVFLTRSGVETVIVSSEGAGFIPRGVFVPRSARILFSEPDLPGDFRSRWFSWVNPAETMLAFAEWAAERSGVELWALAVSTEYGGSAAPARAASIPHFDECSTKPSSPSGAVEPMHLDDGHMHRLETIDRGEYARLTGFGRDGRMPDRSEAWMTTFAAAQTALDRAGTVPDLAVPPIIREVLELLSSGARVPAERWWTLRAEAVQLMSTGSGLRPGWLPDATAASPYVRACHDVARLAELLLLWDLDNDADGPDIKHPEIAYLARQIADSAVGQQERE